VLQISDMNFFRGTVPALCNSADVKKDSRWGKRTEATGDSVCTPPSKTGLPVASTDMQREALLRRLGISASGEAKAVAVQSLARMDMNHEMLQSLRKSQLVQEDEDETRVPSMASPTDDSSPSDDSSDSQSDSPKSGCSDATAAARAYDLVIGGKSQDDQVRLKFLQKLSYERVWLPKAQRPPSHQTLIIFDWDDTLVCSSYLNQMDGMRAPAAVEQQLNACERGSAQLLRLAQSLGQTLIITNAQEGWVETSAEMWCPSLLPLLQKIRVVSARSRYEDVYPMDPMKWKIETFRDVQREFDSTVITNLVSLGDSEYEMEAARLMAKEFQQSSIKLVKFTDRPNPQELLRQLQLMIEELECVVGKAGKVLVDLHRLRVRRPA